MTSLLWFLLGTMAGAPVGFLLCAAFTAGKRADEAPIDKPTGATP